MRIRNRSKFIVISHKEQKQSNVALMNFKNSSFYVQRQTNQMLRSYRKFSRAYMNDIIIFFKTLSKHINHFRQIFQLFQKCRVNLTFIKFFLKYFFITLLNQKVDNFELFTIAKKIAIITSLQFSISLRKLKYFLRLIDWLWHCIERFVQITQSLQIKKIDIIKQLIINVEINENKSFDSIKKKQSNKLIINNATKKKNVFVKLQVVFFNSIFLIYFDSNRSFFVNLNVSKRWSFAIMIYHVVEDSKNDSFSRIVVQSILFLNKLLNDAKKNYWSTKLKVIDIVWVIKHIRHLIDFIKQSFTMIYIDHSTVVSIFKQISLIIFNTNKLNLRLMRASQYLFNFNIIIRHKANKINIVSNVLSRLSKKLSSQSNFSDKIEIFDAFYDYSVNLTNYEFRTTTIQNLSIISYHVTFMKMSNDFKQRFKIVYATNKHWKKMLKIITSSFEINTFQSKSNTSQFVIEKINASKLKNIAIFKTSSSSSKIAKEFFRDIKFQFKKNLIYYTFKTKKKNRLCI